MTTRRKKKYRSTAKIPDEEMAGILAYADQHGAPKAAEHFNISKRSIDRRRRDIREGKSPSLAKVVDRLKRNALERNQDLLTEAYEVVLTQIKKKAPRAQFPDLVKGAKELGDLHVTTKELNRDDAPAVQGGAHSEGTKGPRVADEAPARAKAGGSADESGPARVH